MERTNARGARTATVLTLAAAGAVAVLAARPDSPFTPFLDPQDRAPRLLGWVAGVLRLDALHRDVAAALGAAILFAAAGAFLYSVRQAWLGRVSVRRVIVVGLGLHLLAYLLPLFLSRDVYSYAFYGRMVSEYGVNPYLHIPAEFLQDPFYQVVSQFWIDSPSVYGPAFSALAAGVTAVTEPTIATINAFKAVAALASVATMLLVVVAARRVRPERAAFAAMLVGWNPVILFHNVAGGHNDALVGLAVAGAVLLLLQRRDLWANAALVLGALVKSVAVVPWAMLVVASVARQPRGRRLRWLAAHLGVAAAVSLPFMGPFFSLEDPTFGQLELTTRQGWLAPSRLVLVPLRGLGRVLGGDLGSTIVEVIVRTAFPILLLVVLVALARHLARRPDRLTPEITIAAMGWATLFALMMAPLLLPWYAAWVVPLAWLLPKPARIGVLFISVALVITELISEPTRAPRAWEVMVLWLHWVATPVVLLVLIRLLLEIRRRLLAGPAVALADPLLAEEPAVRSRVLELVDRVVTGDEREHVPRRRQGGREPPGGGAAGREPEPVGGQGGEDGDREPDRGP